jgi:signal transduction histidine kinase
LISPDRLVPVVSSATGGVATPNLDMITLHRRNGQTFPAKVKVIPIELDGEVVAINVFVTDVSEHEQYRAQTRQLEQRALLGEFMGVFAHEVLNPINNFSTGLQNIALRLGKDSPHQELISRMENDVERISHQMEALKNFAKPYEPEQRPVDLGQLLKRIVERWRPRMERLRINYVYQVPEELPWVNGDPRALEQVFTNLISNALDAMHEKGGILSVRASVSEIAGNRPQVDIAISDNGPGIPDEIRDRIFEPFVTTKPMGTGLGLPITKRLVTAHRGSIGVNSFPGGTVFHVYLPAIEEKP